MNTVEMDFNKLFGKNPFVYKGVRYTYMMDPSLLARIERINKYTDLGYSHSLTTVYYVGHPIICDSFSKPPEGFNRSGITITFPTTKL